MRAKRSIAEAIRRRLTVATAFLVGGMPLATTLTCDSSETGGGYRLYSTNDDLLEDVLEIVFGEEDD